MVPSPIGVDALGCGNLGVASQISQASVRPLNAQMQPRFSCASSKGIHNWTASAGQPNKRGRGPSPCTGAPHEKGLRTRGAPFFFCSLLASPAGTAPVPVKLSSAPLQPLSVTLQPPSIALRRLSCVGRTAVFFWVVSGYRPDPKALRCSVHVPAAFTPLHLRQEAVFPREQEKCEASQRGELFG